MAKKPEPELEEIQSEIEDQDSIPASYDIVTYPADYTLEVLESKIARTIIAPGFQRKFVWSIKQASRLIESFLLGLPVPAIFLYADPRTNKYLVVDGQQRLCTIQYFFEGYFGEPDVRGNRTVIKLKGLNTDSPYNERTYQDLKQNDEAAYNRLNEAVLRAFIVKQLRPEGSSSIYQIFERLNTGGTHLVGQEIRNCIYHGPFNDLLLSINEMSEWRAIFGKPSEDKRMRDVELILRFLALYHKAPMYQKPMKKFLSDYMEEHQNDDSSSLMEHKQLFESTTRAVLERLGKRPFNIRAGLNSAAFDGVYVAFARNLNNIPNDIQSRYQSLKANESFSDLVSSATTDEEIVSKRMIL